MLLYYTLIMLLALPTALVSLMAVGSGDDNTSSSNGNQLRQVYSAKSASSNWPVNFMRILSKQYNVRNKKLLALLRKIEGGKWKKVYEDGYLADGTEVSIHYFRSKSGKIFDLKIKFGWSN
jgi:hypothetical protein